MSAIAQMFPLTLFWIARSGSIYQIETALLPPTHTALGWQQVYEYIYGLPAWLERT